MRFKALSVRQPWASMIARGEKTVEVRSWPTSYRGPLLVAATKAPVLPGLPNSCAVAVVELADCVPMARGHEAAAGCRRRPGDYAWVLRDVRPTAGVRVRGKQGLYLLDLDERLLFLEAPGPLFKRVPHAGRAGAH